MSHDYGDEEELETMCSYVAQIAETDKAICFKIAPGFTGKKVWVPRSLLGFVDDRLKIFYVPEWFADQEGI